MTLLVCITEQNRKRCSTPSVPSSWCDVSGQRGICYMHTSLYLPPRPPPSLQHHQQVLACMHYVMVTWLDLIGRSPSYYTRFPPITSFHVGELLQHCDAHGGVQTQNRTRSAPDYYVTFSMTSYIAAKRALLPISTAEQTIWRRLPCIGHLTTTTFWCSYLQLPWRWQ